MAQAALGGVQLIDGLGAPLKPLGEPAPTVANGRQPPQPSAAAQPSSAPGTSTLSSVWARTTPAEHRSLAAQLARSKVAVAPLLTWEHLNSGERQNLVGDLELLPKSLRAAGEFGVGPGSPETQRQSLQRKREFVAALARAKVSIAVGSGTTAEGWPVPGLAVHREIVLLVEAGLTPAEALGAATGAVAETLGDRKGWMIMSGAQADFFAVRGDPLADIGALADITLVVRGGEVLDREALLARARKAVARQ
jgi:imidazolonepropionase-like amidohydrolase